MSIGNFYFEIIDIVFAALSLALAIRGAFRGLIEELSSMAALVLGVIAGLAFRAQLGAFILARWEKLDSRLIWLPDVLAFLGILVAVFLVIKLIGLLLKNISKRIMLSDLDKILGFAFGLIEGLTLSGLILFILQMLSVSAIPALSSVMEGSLFAKFLLPVANETVNNFIGGN
ncbi:MAG: CvpA family protein [Spirochaetaceae bacterium]|jgi:membrane protein required for colicin V production|nr:CvpA family protein [Spirochaetaceae bacterium]